GGMVQQLIEIGDDLTHRSARRKDTHAREPLQWIEIGRLHCEASARRREEECSLTLERYFATCGRGIEPVLADELRALGAVEVEPGRGGVHFAGERALLYQANLWLRTAIRVLWPILQVHVESPDELYEAVRSLDWTRWLTPDHTLA